LPAGSVNGLFAKHRHFPARKCAILLKRMAAMVQ
jgi:hypothetical protein